MADQPPQVKTKRQAEKICKRLKWLYTLGRLQTHNVVHYFCTIEEGINAALEDEWNLLTPAERERITQIVKGD